MSNYLRFFVGYAMVLLASERLLSAPRATASLAPAQAVFVRGEPIDLDLILRNGEEAPLTVGPEYPSFFDREGKRGIKLTAKGRVLVTTHDRDWGEWKGGPPALPHGSSVAWEPPTGFGWGRGKTIRPGESWTVKIFLQQFTRDLEPGDYEFAYSIDIPTISRNKEREIAFRGTGDFRVSVIKGSDSELSTALARHAKTKNGDYWSMREAMEGLILVDSPVVVPYLIHVNPLGATDVILAMKNFKGNREAEAYIFEKLRSSEQRDILAALAVLQKWNYVLPEHEVRRLLNLPKSLSTARIGAILYASELPGRPFESQVKALINDPDRHVAETATRASSTRVEQHEPK
jgi:hypothetical protein